MTELRESSFDKQNGLQSTSSLAKSQNRFFTLWQNALEQKLVIEKDGRSAWMNKLNESDWVEETIISGHETVEF